MHSRYLYIPFSEDENSFNLELKACDWRNHLSNSAKAHKIPTIVQHGKDQFDINADDYITTIYISGHGHSQGEDNPLRENTICNSADTHDYPYYYLSMEEVAARIKKDGLKPEHNARIKLFFCDVVGEDSAKKMAIKFREALGEEFGDSETTIDYYNALVSIPMPQLKIMPGLEAGNKIGVPMQYSEEYKGEENNASSDEMSDPIPYGRASEFRQRISTKTQPTPNLYSLFGAVIPKLKSFLANTAWNFGP